MLCAPLGTHEEFISVLLPLEGRYLSYMLPLIVETNQLLSVENCFSVLLETSI